MFEVSEYVSINRRTSMFTIWTSLCVQNFNMRALFTDMGKTNEYVAQEWVVGILFGIGLLCYR